MTGHRPGQRLTRIVQLAGGALVVAAIAQELRKPAESRIWHGRVVGLVPYDFRIPTLARIRDRMWAPENPQILTPGFFGVGWTVNVGRLVRPAEIRRCNGRARVRRSHALSSRLLDRVIAPAAVTRSAVT
jgi:hypothetical protein